MAKNTKMDFKTAELLSQLPEPQHEPVTPPKSETKRTSDDVVRNLEDYLPAIHRAQLTGETDIEVAEDIFRMPRLGGINPKTTSFTTGNPGVRVFLEGTKDDTLKKEKLSAEAYHEAYMAEMRGDRVEEERRKASR